MHLNESPFPNSTHLYIPCDEISIYYIIVILPILLVIPLVYTLYTLCLKTLSKYGKTCLNSRSDKFSS